MDTTRQGGGFFKGLRRAILRFFRLFSFQGAQAKYIERQEWLRKQRQRYSPIDDDVDLEEPTQKSVPAKSKNQQEELDKRVEQAIKQAKVLTEKSPLGPQFLGEPIEYPESRVRRFFFNRPIPDLTEIRDDLDSFSKIEKVTTTRKRISKLLRIFPHSAEVRALNAILIFNDTMHTGLDEKKLDALRESLIEMALVIYNGGISIYHVNWFIKIYIRYLETLQRKLLAEYNTDMSNYHWKVRKTGSEIHQVMVQVTSMLGLKDHLTGMTMLNAKLKGSAYIYDCLTWQDIREACQIQEGGESKTIGVGKSANYIIWEIFTVSSLFARIPIFKNLLSEILTVIPENTKAFTLQKNMVSMVVSVSEYQNAVAVGDINRRVEIATNIYRKCVDTISQYLRHSNPTKVYELDPFLKAAWITKESSGLFDGDVYRAMVQQSMEYLTTVIRNTDSVKGSSEIAKQLQDDLLEIMGEFGWSSFDS